MNILHLNSENSWRGGEQQLSYLLQGLRKNQSHKLYLMGRAGSKLQTWCETNDIEFISAAFSGSADIFTSLKIAKTCKMLKIDMMHAHTSHAHASALYSKFFLNKAKLIIHRRVSFPIKDNLISSFKYKSNLISNIICVSKNVQTVLTQKTQQPNKTTVIYDSVDINRFTTNKNYNESFIQRYQLPESQFIVANTSALSSEKDYITFINTAEECLKKNLDIIFLIAGKGPEHDNIANLILKKKLTSHVFLLGFVSDIPDLLNNIDLFLMTSLQEGLGSSILGAFITKKAVVATDAGGIPELVTHRQTGMLTKTKDYKQLAQHIQTILNDPSLAKKITQNAYKVVNKQFLTDQMIEQTEHVYKTVLNSDNK